MTSPGISRSVDWQRVRILYGDTQADSINDMQAAPAKADAREGGEYSYWGGDIHGIFTKLVSEKLFEQDWYGHDNPEWKYNVSFTFDGAVS
jgi:hypothetical protein